MDKVISYLKKADYVKVSWWSAILADVIYLITVGWCIKLYLDGDGGPEYQHGMLDYIWDNQQKVFLFGLGCFLLILALFVLYIPYISNHSKGLKITMILCGMIQAYFWVSVLLEKIIRIEWLNGIFQLFLLVCYAPAIITGIVSFILFVIDKKCRKTILLLSGTAIFYFIGIGLIIVVALLLGLYCINKLLNWFLYSPREVTYLEEKDAQGNVIGRWTIER